MISKNELKFYSSLLHKKFRLKENKFLAEGEKIVLEGLKSNFNCDVIITTPSFADQNEQLISSLASNNIRIELASTSEFNRISDTETPQGIIGVFESKHWSILNEKFNDERVLLYLENISEPGNLGTLLRTADWFGVKSVLISKNSVELFNPKVIRSSMGSIFNLKIFTEVELNQIIHLKSEHYSFLCADLNGKNIFNFQKSGSVILSMSNESSGPSQELLKISDEVITIPKLGKAESLNVATAAAVLLAQLTSNTK